MTDPETGVSEGPEGDPGRAVGGAVLAIHGDLEVLGRGTSSGLLHSSQA